MNRQKVHVRVSGWVDLPIGAAQEKGLQSFLPVHTPRRLLLHFSLPCWTVELVGFAMSWLWPWPGVSNLVAPEAPPSLR